MKQVTRRFMEGDRDLVVWVTSVAPAQVKHKMLRGLAYHIRGYALTKRSASATVNQETSQLQICTLVMLDRACNADTLRALTNFLIITSAQHIRVHQRNIENTLIDESIARKTAALAQ